MLQDTHQKSAARIRGHRRSLGVASSLAPDEWKEIVEAADMVNLNKKNVSLLVRTILLDWARGVHEERKKEK